MFYILTIMLTVYLNMQDTIDVLIQDKTAR